MSPICPNSISIDTMTDDLLLYVLKSLTFTFVGTKIHWLHFASRYPNGTSNRTRNFCPEYFNAPQTTIYYVIKTNFETYDGDIVTFYIGK